MRETRIINSVSKKISKVEDEEFPDTKLNSSDDIEEKYGLSELQRKKIKKSKRQLAKGMRLTNDEVNDDVEKWFREK